MQRFSRGCRSVVQGGVFGVMAVFASLAAAVCPPLWMANPNSGSAGIQPPPVSWMTAMKAWDPDGAGPSYPVLVCANGANLPVAGCGKIGAWTGSGWIPMSTPSEFNSVRAFYVDTDNTLYAAVSTFTANHVMYRWTGSAWQSVGTGATANGFSITKYNNEFIIGGNIGISGGGNVARLSGSQWQPMGPGLYTIGTSAIVRSVAVYNGTLYAAGDFQVVGPLPNTSPCAYFARWTGTTWQPVPGWSFGAAGPMLVYGSNLAIGTSSGVYLYNGSTFQLLGGTTPGWVASLETFNGELVAGSEFGAGGSPRIYRWNGSSWQTYGVGVGGGSGGVLSLATWTSPDGYELVAGGSFNAIGGSPQSPYWGRWISPGDAEVTVQPPPRIRACGPNSIFISLNASGGYLSYQWRRNGVPISNGGTFSGSVIGGATTPSLSITNTSAMDSDLYDCVITNPCGSVTSSATAVTITNPPMLVQQPQSLLRCQGQSGTYTVNSISTQTQTYQWYIETITPPTYIQLLTDGPTGSGAFISGANTPSMTIFNVQPADEALYFCVVTAGCGQIESARAGLTVRGYPVITSFPPLPIQISGHASFSLSISATQNFPGTLQYNWRRNGNIIYDGASCGSTISGASTPLLTVTNVAGVDSGLYDCVVYGDCGFTESYLMSVTVCPADVDDGSATGTPDGGVGSEDLAYFLQLYSDGDPAGDLDDSSNTGTPDCGVGIEDLLYFLVHYGIGC